ncbi:putative bifunctional diguanylate cyclase/phosphodiesterase [Bradyrhizobium sp. SYSU BS000235]|uniref:putative bifunctional diguanylate cyclase/phosphodiesterase n=1 Tax=Bradyrhizobium sp. SYSU BS000235 TaxID=3411332 RepID=UPI003C74A7B4
MVAVEKVSRAVTGSDSDKFSDVAVLRRKWHAALKPETKLPSFEDVMLGSLGRLSDHVMLIKGVDSDLEISRAGRYVETWLDMEVWDTPLTMLPPDCALMLEEAAASACRNGKPHLTSAHCVRDGLVQAYDIFALPMTSRWGETLVGAYVNERGQQYNLLDAIFYATDDGILSLATIRDAHERPFDFQIVQFNQGTAKLLGVEADELRWRRLSTGSHALCSPEIVAKLTAVISSNCGDQFEVSVGSNTLKINAAPVGELISISLTDVTNLKRREQSFRLLFESNPMPMWVFDAETKEFLNVNDAAVKHYGYSRSDFLTMKLQDIWPRDEWEEHTRALGLIGDVYQSGSNWRHLKADGSEIEVLTFGRRVPFNDRDAFLVSAVDITERRKAEARVAFMAHHDALTGLPNRVLFQERLQSDLARTKQIDKRIAVLCIDLDLFKHVNDSFGHPMGDRLLKMVAERLGTNLRATDLVARLGGDEFAMILEMDSSPNEVSQFAARLIDRLSEPYSIDSLEIVIGASVGIAISPGDGKTGEDFLRNADMALYRAKSEGGGVHRFFEKDMDRAAQKRRDMELDLRYALANDEFELHYQPLIDVSENRIVAFESLVRWNHPKKGMISPADFIPVAEDIGLIVQLGEWVLKEACEQAAQWPKDIKVAVNLSPVQFRSRNLVPAVIGALARSGLSPFRLELEITESIFLAETEANLATLHQLRELGVRISMDDFGTGYSSLSYLRSFPFDKIKIDRSFVRDLADRSDCAAIIRAISGLGRSLNISTTAEGVETEDQLDALRAEGCTEVQGFLFSAARPASEISELIATFGKPASQAA